MLSYAFIAWVGTIYRSLKDLAAHDNVNLSTFSFFAV